MPSRLSASELVDREFLQIRCRLIEVAAALDRIELGRDPETIRADDRLERIREAARLLGSGSVDRSRRVQMLFSLPYDEDGRTG